MYSCILLSLLFPGHFIFRFRVDFAFLSRSAVKLAALLLLCFISVLYLSFLRAAGILVFNDSFCFPFLSVLHETSGTRIFLKCIIAEKKKNETMNR